MLWAIHVDPGVWFNDACFDLVVVGRRHCSSLLQRSQNSATCTAHMQGFKVLVAQRQSQTSRQVRRSLPFTCIVW